MTTAMTTTTTATTMTTTTMTMADAVGGMATTGCGRGEDMTTEQTQQSNRSQKRGGKTVVTAVTMTTTMTTTTTMMKLWSDHGCGDGEWRAAATAVAVATRGCFGNKIRRPR